MTSPTTRGPTFAGRRPANPVVVIDTRRQMHWRLPRPVGGFIPTYVAYCWACGDYRTTSPDHGTAINEGDRHARTCPEVPGWWPHAIQAAAGGAS